LHGPDVRALQRALHKAGYRRGKATGDFRRATRRQVVNFQKHHGIHRHRGVVNPSTWAYLQRYFDGYDHYLVSHYKLPTKAATAIDRFVKAAWWYYGNRPLHYLQERPMQGTAAPPNLDRYLDCSEFVYVCAKAAGLPDPSGYGYTAYGNTYSYLDHMPSVNRPERGGLAFYDDPSHVVIIVGQSNNVWMCLSNGSDGGPQYIPILYRTPSAYRTFRGLK
jgi:hypothetical protein